MMTYPLEVLQKLSTKQLKSAKKNFYKRTKRIGVPATFDELHYIITLKSELLRRRYEG